jgi:hypothetical protein
MMNGDDIKWDNRSMPRFPKGMSLWQRVLCLLGYHKWETRQSAKGHCYGVQTEEGKRRGIFGIHDETPMKLRDQCGRCGTLL